MALGYGRTSTQNFSVADFIVDGGGIQNGATHSNISSAMSSAVSGQSIFVRPGTYTENFSMKSGVNLVAAETSRFSLTTKIVGKITYTDTGLCTISNFYIETNGDYALEVTGTNNSKIYLNNCYLYAVDNIGVNINNSNASSVVLFSKCTTNQNSTFALYTFSSSGKLVFRYSDLNSNGGTVATSNSSSSTVAFEYSFLTIPISTSSTGMISFQYSRIETTNQTCLTLAGSGSSQSTKSIFVSGTASAITVGSGSILGLTDASISSSNTNAITGAGTVNYNSTFYGSSSLVNTTTKTSYPQHSSGISFDFGSNNLNYYEEGTFTPTMLGTSTPGVGTYSIQSGRYTRIGNRVFFTSYCVWSAHTGTGLILCGNLPFTSSSAANTFSPCAVWVQNLTFSAQLTTYVIPNSTNIQIQGIASNTTAANVSVDTTGSFMVSGHYFV